MNMSTSRLRQTLDDSVPTAKVLQHRDSAVAHPLDRAPNKQFSAKIDDVGKPDAPQGAHKHGGAAHCLMKISD
jgi:hypothetical protein